MAKHYDVILVHPPSFPYFREVPTLPGPIDRTVPNYTYLFIMFPVGLLSIASYLNEHGVKVRIFNLAERLLTNKNFKLDHFFEQIKADLIGIDMHWSVHSMGAIECARIAKQIQPDSIVFLGGLTATVFAEEIVRSFEFVDAVVRGEGEKPILALAQNLQKFKKTEAFAKTPSITYRERDGRTVSTPIHELFTSLDELNFTRFDLVEPFERTLTSPFTGDMLWNIPITRGCVLNCAGCGGSRTSYRVLLDRTLPAFRSPKKIFEDLLVLDKMGVKSVFLFQDPRLGGNKYVDELLSTLKDGNWSHIKNIGLELFWPAKRDYLERLVKSRMADYIGLSISPESGNDFVRKAHGRHYDTTSLIRTVDDCVELGIPIGVFFLIALGHESHETIRETWDLWEKLLSKNKGNHMGKVSVDFGPMVLLDPGSPAFYEPDKYGYKILFRSIKDYYHSLKIPHWKHWINYETMYFDKFGVGRLILDCWEALSTIKWKLGQLTDREYELDSLRVRFERTVYEKIDQVLTRQPDEIIETCKELVAVSRDPFLTWSYLATEEAAS
ncbi:MAG: cobalamin-dependent protein [Candidatus Caldarchaeum sp.]|nr:cobalamin-dependent protein [Candidatus Caldarchaeum sp.]